MPELIDTELLYITKALEILGESKVSGLKVREASGEEEVLEVDGVFGAGEVRRSPVKQAIVAAADGAIAAMAVDKFINKRSQLIPQYKCPYCQQLKKCLNEQDVAFEERNIELNDAYGEELHNMGFFARAIAYENSIKR